MTNYSNKVVGGLAVVALVLLGAGFAVSADKGAAVLGGLTDGSAQPGRFEGVDTWVNNVPLPPGIEVSDSGRARDGKGYYLNGLINSDLRSLTTYYDREMVALGWELTLHERAPGKTLRVAYVRADQKLVMNFAVISAGAMVSMAVGPYVTRQVNI